MRLGAADLVMPHQDAQVNYDALDLAPVFLCPGRLAFDKLLLRAKTRSAWLPGALRLRPSVSPVSSILIDNRNLNSVKIFPEYFFFTSKELISKQFSHKYIEIYLNKWTLYAIRLVCIHSGCLAALKNRQTLKLFSLQNCYFLNRVLVL